MFKLLPLFCLCTFAFAAEPAWVSATDEKHVTREGEWRVDRFSPFAQLGPVGQTEKNRSTHHSPLAFLCLY